MQGQVSDQEHYEYSLINLSGTTLGDIYKKETSEEDTNGIPWSVVCIVSASVKGRSHAPHRCLLRDVVVRQDRLDRRLHDVRFGEVVSRNHLPRTKKVVL